MLSDLIENTATSRPFVTGQVQLPHPREPFLNGISMVLVELPALAEASGLQNFATRSSWRRWCNDAGALSCEVTAPGMAEAEVREASSQGSIGP